MPVSARVLTCFALLVGASAFFLSRDADAQRAAWLWSSCKDTALGDVEVMWGGIRYKPGDTGYDGCLTSGGRQYDHTHTLYSYPVPTLPGDGFSDNQVTAAEVDSRYIQDKPNRVIVQSALTQFNCHGFTTNHLTLWPEMEHGGINRIVEDEYRGLYVGEHGTYWFENSQWSRESTHSFKVVSWGMVLEWDERRLLWVPHYYPQEIQEKWLGGPIMKWTYSGGANWPDLAYSSYYKREKK